MLEYFEKPYKFLRNNRKQTRGRIALEKAQKVQSIPIYELIKDIDGFIIDEIFKGYKYIYHK